MQSITNIGLPDVQAVYGGPEGKLWELVMGQQIHIGGFQSSMALAEKAGIQPGTLGVDLCCCSGAGMRFLVRFRKVERMRGVDATEAMIELGRRRCQAEGFADRIDFTLSDACATSLHGGTADFVWGEDAWCYVADKRRLVAEAVRLLKPHGTIAFTDWIEGPTAFTDGESDRLLKFMKFPNILGLDDYVALLNEHGCDVSVAEDTGQFAPHVDLYLNMLHMQLTYDALQIIGFDTALMGALATEMQFMRDLAHSQKLVQGRFVAKKKA